MINDRNGFISAAENYEINDWLEKKGYRKTKENREHMKRCIEALGVIYLAIDKQKGMLTWNDLEEVYENGRFPFADDLFEKTE